MKKILSLILSVLLLVSLFGCADKKAPEAPAAYEPSPAPVPSDPQNSEPEQAREAETPVTGPAQEDDIPVTGPAQEDDIPVTEPAEPANEAAPVAGPDIVSENPPAENETAWLPEAPEAPVTEDGAWEGELDGSEPLYAEPLSYSFEAQYIRTDGYRDGADYPQLRILRSAADVRDYCALAGGIYNTDRLLPAMEKYDDAWFDSGKLLIVVVLEEGSGSIRHEVTCLTRDFVRIDCRIPEVGTCDMAEWHILIETDSMLSPSEDLSVTFTNNLPGRIELELGNNS